VGIEITINYENNVIRMNDSEPEAKSFRKWKEM
jgi:hypothetical protein